MRMLSTERFQALPGGRALKTVRGVKVPIPDWTRSASAGTGQPAFCVPPATSAVSGLHNVCQASTPASKDTRLQIR